MLVAVAATPGIAPAATTTTTTGAAPEALWNAYPLQPGETTPEVSLPPSSARPAPARVRPGSTGAGDGDDGGGTPLALTIVIAALALAIGALVGVRLRRRRAQPSAAAPEAAAPRPAFATAGVSVPRPTPPRARADPQPQARRAEVSRRERREPAPRPAARPAGPPPTRAPATARAPTPAPAPPRSAPAPGGTAAPAIPTPAERFRRVPWPTGTEALWRCEISRHYGVVRGDFRALAFAPGRRRPVELGRSDTHVRPGWGIEAGDEELLAEVRRLVDALGAAGWERVRPGRGWYAARFVWAQPEAPPLELPDLAATRQETDDH
ncbi:hypothetical protein DSM104299_04791 [Baekduia alba]|uniref:hypothetical protein n=1 Tax=Baekduia alba TaxID=2997333 RepID=UPI0023419D49|nr:hypothetical protein [Baekduia alba]WCB96037.1 hypothetical protein DSM104299_04791 [Baekduia alba]